MRPSLAARWTRRRSTRAGWRRITTTTSTSYRGSSPKRYANWDAVLGYCVYSANPVGRLVLYLCGYRDEQRQRLSDATCTALQLANFWQDVSRDLDIGRIYIPLDAAAAQGLTENDIVE